MFFCVNFLTDYLISIPSFQFLMVRLKDKNVTASNLHKYISIPYGAIIMIQKYKMFLEKPNF